MEVMSGTLRAAFLVRSRTIAQKIIKFCFKTERKYRNKKLYLIHSIDDGGNWLWKSG